MNDDDDAAWRDSINGVEVYADYGEYAGTVRIILPSAVDLSPDECLAFILAIAAASGIAGKRRMP